MPIKVKCPNAECGKILAVKDEFAGKRAKCPGCGGTIQIPNGAPAAAIAPAKPAPAKRPAAPPPVDDEGFAAAPPPAAKRRAAAPAPAESGYEEGGEAWGGGPAPKSGLVTAVAIINFVLGGLAFVCGAIGLLFASWFTGAAALASTTPLLTMQVGQAQGGLPKGFDMPKIDMKDMPKIDMKDFNQKMGEANKALAQGRATVRGGLAFLATLMFILSILNILWGGAAIAGGIGLLQRRNWGRLLTLVLAGVAGVEGLVYIAPIFMGAPLTTVVLNVLLYLAYAGFVFFVLLKPEVRREFA